MVIVEALSKEQRMARLEKELRQALGFFEKIKMTVARMIRERSCAGS